LTRTKRLALAFYIGAVAAGATVGITLDRWLLRERLVNQWSDARAMRNRLADELRLDATQRAALDTILDDRNRRYEDLMMPVRPQLDSVGDAARAQIRQLLTPEQQAIYDKMQREREEARRQEKKQ
jgi:hypothetical protein